MRPECPKHAQHTTENRYEDNVPKNRRRCQACGAFHVWVDRG